VCPTRSQLCSTIHRHSLAGLLTPDTMDETAIAIGQQAGGNWDIAVIIEVLRQNQLECMASDAEHAYKPDADASAWIVNGQIVNGEVRPGHWHAYTKLDNEEADEWSDVESFRQGRQVGNWGPTPVGNTAAMTQRIQNMRQDGSRVFRVAPLPVQAPDAWTCAGTVTLVIPDFGEVQVPCGSQNVGGTECPGCLTNGAPTNRPRWNCGVCGNRPCANTCPSCNTPRELGEDLVHDEPVPEPEAPPAVAQPADGQWNCIYGCPEPNEPSAENCYFCQSPKPASGPWACSVSFCLNNSNPASNPRCSVCDQPRGTVL